MNEDRWNNDEGTGLRDQVLSSQSRRRYNEDISTDRKQQGDWPYCCARGEQEKQILKERMMNSGRREGERKRVYNIKKKKEGFASARPSEPAFKIKKIKSFLYYCLYLPLGGLFGRGPTVMTWPFVCLSSSSFTAAFKNQIFARKKEKISALVTHHCSWNVPKWFHHF